MLFLFIMLQTINIINSCIKANQISLLLDHGWELWINLSSNHWVLQSQGFFSKWQTKLKSKFEFRAAFDFFEKATPYWIPMSNLGVFYAQNYILYSVSLLESQTLTAGAARAWTKLVMRKINKNYRNYHLVLEHTLLQISSGLGGFILDSWFLVGMVADLVVCTAGSTVCTALVTSSSCPSSWGMLSMSLFQLHIASGFSFMIRCVVSAFFFRNCSFLLAFLLKVEGLGFFLARGVGDFSFPMVSRERVKVEPIVREKVKGVPLSTSAWQSSRHFDFRLGSTSLTAAIFWISSQSVKCFWL